MLMHTRVSEYMRSVALSYTYSIRQHTSAYVSIRLAYVSIRQHSVALSYTYTRSTYMTRMLLYI
jgi:hypothetical protein